MDGDRSQPECEGCRRLEARVAELQATVDRLQKLLEAKQREGKRQAAPFRKPKPAAPPKKPGRKTGDEHGPHAHRTVPDSIDERHAAPLPACCPHCRSGRLVKTASDTQYQVEIVRKSVTRQFDVERGRCEGCGRAVQGRHELQISDALGAAGVQLGPEAHAALTLLSKQAGLSCGKINAFFETFFGIKISRSTVCRSVLRTARRCENAYEAIKADVRGSPFVVPDETGWRLGGRNAWLHVFVGSASTCYDIGDRSVKAAAGLLGLDWAGTLIHDGWSVYDHFTQAAHQQCLAHLARRCEGLLETARRGAARLPRRVLELIDRAYALRRDWRDGKITADEQAAGGLALTGELEKVAGGRFTYDPNRRLAGHLRRHAAEWFWFLFDPAIDATNWRAEQAIRPAVLLRKVWGGNRTAAGAKAQSILCSVLTTLKQRRAPAFDWLTQTLRSPSPAPIPAAGR